MGKILNKELNLMIVLLIGWLGGAPAYASTIVQQVSGDEIKADCGHDVHQHADIDGLAAGLAEHFDVYRVQKSIVVRLSGGAFFGKGPDDALTRNGKNLITKLADDLLCYPDTNVFIQHISGSSAAGKYQAETRVLLMQHALMEKGVDINRLEIALSTPSESPQSIKAGNNRTSISRLIELIIIPRV